MATGDDAIAAGMDILDPSTDLVRDGAEQINQTRDYIAQRTASITPVAKGGTGSTTAEGARTNLGALAASDVVVSTSGATIANTVPRYDGSGRLAAGNPAAANHVATKAYVDANSGIGSSGGTINGGDLRITGSGNHLYVTAATAASSGYTVGYINGDGRLAKGASSERYKKFISAVDPLGMGNVWPILQRFQMKQGDGTWKYGYIAERLDEDEDLQPFVVYDAEGRPDSIDFIALLMVQNAELNERVKALEEAAE